MDLLKWITEIYDAFQCFQGGESTRRRQEILKTSIRIYGDSAHGLVDILMGSEGSLDLIYFSNSIFFFVLKK